jgi:glycosyltransferase involved in cell wall biosynthesis
MRIAVLTDVYPPAATGGYERSCADVVARWRRAGHQVTVLTTPAQVPHVHGVRRVLPFAKLLAGNEGRGDVRAREASDGETVSAELKRLRPDVVSVWNLARVSQRAVLSASRAVAPVVLVACDGWLADAPRDVGALPAGSRLVWVSAALRDRTAVPPWVPADQHVVGSGIDPDTFPVRRRRRPPWEYRLLYVGRLAPAKGVDDAIMALARLPSAACLQVVGAGSQERRAELRVLSTRLGVADRVRFTVAERAELPAVYHRADAVLFPSRWEEPFGLVPLEAMACGTPVIATGTGGSAGYLRHASNAVLVPPQHPAALAAAVHRLAGRPALRARLVRHGMRTARAHSIAEVAARLEVLHRLAATTSV